MTRHVRRHVRAESLLAVAALASFALGWACGRNDLDSPVDPIGGDTGGVGAIGAGGGGGGLPGTGGRGAGGVGIGGAGIGGRGTGGEGPMMSIPCGATFCNGATQVCCAVPNPTGGPGTAMCVPANDPNACTGGVSLACLDATSCAAGDICCVVLAAQRSLCTFPTACSAGGGVGICASNQECTSSGGICCPVLSRTRGICLSPGFCSNPRGIPPP